ncbi:MAG: hypothetical protein HY077_10635 [Elusimicrobia bacterium]|nr:hypothetical protein [Elusimicrobiota bacterium]
MTGFLFGLLVSFSAAQAPSTGTWTFAVSGDSRNCGDVVMPAIAARVRGDGAAFYWHLGDLRAIYKTDEDIKRRRGLKTSRSAYKRTAWDDFIAEQIKPFGELPFFVGIGNHETIWPKSREEFVKSFSPWLDAPALKDQRLKDDPKDQAPRTYFHWLRRGVDFIYLDNATTDEFDAVQLAWLERVLARDRGDPSVKALVVGMHEALPQSISANHSMDQSKTGEETGRRVYRALLAARGEGKNVYVLASHSHFYMDGTFNTAFWRSNGGILPGWIVGTAGAVRYALPKASVDAREAKTNVYGYLLGRAEASGKVDFEFRQIAESEVPAAVAARYDEGFVHWCFAKNSEAPGG